MKNRLVKIFIIFGEAVLLYVCLNFNIGCFFKKTFGIRCPGCGLTRAFLSIFRLDFLSAFKYNIISIPLFIIIIIINILLIYDIFLNKNKISNFLKSLTNYYILIFVLIIVTTVVNNIIKI